MTTALALAGLTAAAMAVLGYHPYAEDGGVYTAALELRMHPALFPVERGFVMAHLNRSLFAPLVCGIVRVTHLPLSYLLLVLQVLSVFTLLYASLRIARRVFRSAEAQWSAVVTVAMTLSLPVAGTALYIADPYVTARSFSTPLLLLAVAAVIEKRLWSAMLFVAVTALVHPLMAIWGALAVLCVAAADRRQRKRAIALACLITMAAGAAVFALFPVEDALQHRVAASRGYWFLADWRWFEVVGAVVPLLILTALVLWRARRREAHDAAWSLMLGSLLAFAISLGLAVLFARPTAGSLMLARIQPLRTMQIGYELFFLLLGGWAGQLLLKRSSWRWVLYVLLLAVPAWFAQRQIYAASGHFEAPWQMPKNEWAQAFLWARENTPTQAVFALDAHYTSEPGEDAQNFRAIAMRSSLPDYAKDGGVASVTTKLASAWEEGWRAQRGLERSTDAERRQRLVPLGVQWVVLQAGSATSLPCAYRNDAAKVCRLR